MHDTANELRKTVERYLKRTGISPSRLGREALKRPGFVRAFLNGCSPRLDTADSLLTHMGLEPIGPRFRCEVETYLEITGANRSAPGEQALNDTAFVGRLFDGLAPQLETVDKLRAWMRDSSKPGEWQRIEAAVAAALAAAERIRKEAAASVACLPPYVSANELATFLEVHPRTLRRWRRSDRGPTFHEDGRWVRYARENVEEWLASRERRSTSGPGKAHRRRSPRAPGGGR
ncbi:MAG: helix-turn-helix domain-containing protein [Rhodospirillaceae bacterium]|nr:helix-turn-helix domain-containing protein [Rhodospirillaceae bacterium]